MTRPINTTGLESTNAYSEEVPRLETLAPVRRAGNPGASWQFFACLGDRDREAPLMVCFIFGIQTQHSGGFPVKRKVGEAIRPKGQARYVI